MEYVAMQYCQASLKDVKWWSRYPVVLFKCCHDCDPVASSTDCQIPYLSRRCTLKIKRQQVCQLCHAIANGFRHLLLNNTILHKQTCKTFCQAMSLIPVHQANKKYITQWCLLTKIPGHHTWYNRLWKTTSGCFIRRCEMLYQEFEWQYSICTAMCYLCYHLHAWTATCPGTRKIKIECTSSMHGALFSETFIDTICFIYMS